MCFISLIWKMLAYKRFDIVIPLQKLFRNYSFMLYLQSVILLPLLSLRHLGANPFVCDCNLAWLASYLTENPIETSGARCQEPAKLSRKPFNRLKQESFKCKSLSE